MIEALYIHWPFCPYRCIYCPFVACEGHEKLMDSYAHALVQEIDSFSRKTPIESNIKTIYFGGGTPSTISDKHLLDISDILRMRFFCEHVVETTIEINPGTVRAQQISAWKDVGINRLSIGVQSDQDHILHLLGRKQQLDDVVKLFDMTRGVFDNISVDMMLGLPGVTVEQWKAFVEKVISWPITHVSLYFLTVHEQTKLWYLIEQGAFVLPDENSVIEMYHWTCDRLATAGLFQYEVSNFAREGYASKHNQAYWDRKQYKGFGVSASSFDGVRRCQNDNNLTRYMKLCHEGSDPVTFEEVLTEEQQWLEVLMLGLRRTSGISFHEICKGLTEQENKKFIEIQQQLKSHCLVDVRDGVMRITRQGLPVENEILARLATIKNV
jgi:oxygen-independent coproporphyrinogen-3 oxidase